MPALTAKEKIKRILEWTKNSKKKQDIVLKYKRLLKVVNSGESLSTRQLNDLKRDYNNARTMNWHNKNKDHHNSYQKMYRSENPEKVDNWKQNERIRKGLPPIALPKSKISEEEKRINARIFYRRYRQKNRAKVNKQYRENYHSRESFRKDAYDRLKVWRAHQAVVRDGVWELIESTQELKFVPYKSLLKFEKYFVKNGSGFNMHEKGKTKVLKTFRTVNEIRRYFRKS